MARTAADRFNRSAQDIRLLGEHQFLLDVSGHLTVDARYDFHHHPNYRPGRLDVNRCYQTPRLDPRVKLHWPQLVEILKSLPGKEEMPGVDTDILANDIPF